VRKGHLLAIDVGSEMKANNPLFAASPGDLYFTLCKKALL
jgi:hypothetical protein